MAQKIDNEVEQFSTKNCTVVLVTSFVHRTRTFDKQEMAFQKHHGRKRIVYDGM